MLDALDALKLRTSINHIDPTQSLSDLEIKDLVSYASQAPSSFNIQHWRFIAVRQKLTKEKLQELAFGQTKVTESAVTFIILGDLKGYEKLHQAMLPLLKSGKIDQKTFDGILGKASQFYSGNAQACRDEAIRSASLAAMNLMTAAQAKGLVSCPMVGFDPVGVKLEFNIPEDQLPVMLLSVGYPAQGNFPKKPRFSVEQILSFEQGQDWKNF